MSTEPLRAIFVCSVLVATMLVGVDCLAISRLEQAEVKSTKGSVCFSIPSNKETRDGVSLYSILVSDAKAIRPGVLPEEQWYTAVTSDEKPLLLKPKDCISYG
ncbi:hypothetical protein G4G28_07010 [Massilia sp. Dwa41.01b]|uniref:hypothetical protein n=1 Tax=unclassified Massilia TaxID=2609279 RepID=UPI001603796C|nr:MULTISPECIES: hypothetical protein [unclassified Massilia]QNA88314.1 hypothetical protein G4G28_07010 [Massilia sp. Dwa41.01b]QNA99215.1 hypothetical protein G4G31_10720 [Massilia sp. Se16.2.3]